MGERRREGGKISLLQAEVAGSQRGASALVFWHPQAHQARCLNKDKASASGQRAER